MRWSPCLLCWSRIWCVSSSVRTRPSQWPADFWNSVERIKHYCNLQQESPPDEHEGSVDDKWPDHGTVVFQSVHMRYRSGLPMILKGLTFTVPSGARVGIVGRTGAGKSSLIQCIYRTIELAAGSIAIGGIDIRSLPLAKVSEVLGHCAV